MLESVRVDDEGAGASSPAIVLCHGFGANAADLAPLARELQVPVPARWYFPEAPYRFQLGWGGAQAWFPRDPAGVESFLTGDTFGSLGDLDPPGLSVAAAELIEFLQVNDCPPDRTVIGGFSQGAIVAAAATLDMPALPAGLVLFSGSIIASRRLESLAASRAGDLEGFRIWQSHGREDPILPFAAGRALGELFAAAGATVEFTGFSGGHGIPPGLFPGVSDWIARSIGAVE